MTSPHGFSDGDLEISGLIFTECAEDDLRASGSNAILDHSCPKQPELNEK
jgi:hypothetical protein